MKLERTLIVRPVATVEGDAHQKIPRGRVPDLSALVQSWPEIARLAREGSKPAAQAKLGL